MRERPILFSGAMVRAILAGTKTQTRRIVRSPAKPYPGHRWAECLCAEIDVSDQPCVRCSAIANGAEPYGSPGDRLWVRETFCVAHRNCWDAPKTVNPGCPDEAAYYAAGWERSAPGAGWKPSIHMPRWASRVALEVTSVRVERLQDISEDDARAEGCPIPGGMPGRIRVKHEDGHVTSSRGTIHDFTARGGFCHLWDGINAARAPWSSNPWVWVVAFRRVQP